MWDFPNFVLGQLEIAFVAFIVRFNLQGLFETVDSLFVLIQTGICESGMNRVSVIGLVDALISPSHPILPYALLYVGSMSMARLQSSTAAKWLFSLLYAAARLQ